MQNRFKSAVRCPLQGVSEHAWWAFVRAMMVQLTGEISLSGGLGAYDMRPRRLVELKYASGLRSLRSPSGRQINTCTFTPPWTQERFLRDSLAQYTAFVRSIKQYYNALLWEEIAKPEGVQMSGALGILHRGGRGALAAWPELFDETRALYDRVCKLF